MGQCQPHAAIPLGGMCMCGGVGGEGAGEEEDSSSSGGGQPVFHAFLLCGASGGTTSPSSPLPPRHSAVYGHI